MNCPEVASERPRRAIRCVKSLINFTHVELRHVELRPTCCVEAEIIIYVFRQVSMSVVGSSAAKAALVRSIAIRVVSGEFNGSLSLASRDLECMARGVSHQSIDYHIGLINPSGGLARAADRARVETAPPPLHTCPLFLFLLAVRSVGLKCAF